MTNGRHGADQSILPDPAQDVAGQHRAAQDQGIGVKLPAGQPFGIQVRLEFTVKLLGCPMIGVECDDVFGLPVGSTSLPVQSAAPAIAGRACRCCAR